MIGLNKYGVPFLMKCVNDEDGAPLVRHEALLSLSNILKDTNDIEIIEFKKDTDYIIRDTCKIANANIKKRT